MKKLFLLLLFITHCSFGQNYIPYHQTINQAELALIDSNYQKAFKHYQTAFKKVEKPFAKDYYNATVCCILLGKKKQAASWCEKMMEKGIPITYFEKETFFTEFRKSKEWQKIVEKYPKIRKKYENKPPYESLRKSLDSVRKVDQAIRADIDEYKRLYNDSLWKTNYSNVQFLLKIIQQYDYPDENKLGTPAPYYNMRAQVVLYHFFQSTYPFSFQDSIKQHGEKEKVLLLLKQEVINGRLEPFEFVSFDEIYRFIFGLPHQYRTIWYGKIGEKVGIDRYDYPENQLAKINQNMQAIGLGNIQDLVRKAKYEFVYAGKSPFLFLKGTTTMSYSDTPESHEKFNKKYEIIK